MPALTLTQLEDLFITATVAMTSLPIDSITLSYQPDSAPFNPQAMNHAYLYVEPMTSEADKFTYPVLTSTDDPTVGTLTQAYTRVIQCTWSFYGPASYELADATRASILTDRIREPLRLQQIYPLPRIPTPQRMPREMSANQWWQRTDIKVQFNVQTDHSALQTYFGSASVDVLESGGDSEVITIQP